MTMYKKNKELERHEEMRKLSIYSYKRDPETLPAGYTLEYHVDSPSGFAASVLMDPNGKPVIAYRGTDKYSGKDIKDDIVKGANIESQQLMEAEDLFKQVQKQYNTQDVSVTGHSAGGTNAAYLGAKYGLEAVTFNPHGTGDLLNDKNTKDGSKVVNYCNPRDAVPSSNARSLPGKIYEVDTKAFTTKTETGPLSHHKAEDMNDLRSRVETTKPDLKNKHWDLYKKEHPYQTGVAKAVKNKDFSDIGDIYKGAFDQAKGVVKHTKDKVVDSVSDITDTMIQKVRSIPNADWFADALVETRRQQQENHQQNLQSNTLQAQPKPISLEQAGKYRQTPYADTALEAYEETFGPIGGKRKKKRNPLIGSFGGF